MAVLLAQDAMSQITLQCVKPGQQVTVAPDNDTLWIMNDYRKKKKASFCRKNATHSVKSSTKKTN